MQLFRLGSQPLSKGCNYIGEMNQKKSALLWWDLQSGIATSAHTGAVNGFGIHHSCWLWWMENSKSIHSTGVYQPHSSRQSPFFCSLLYQSFYDSLQWQERVLQEFQKRWTLPTWILHLKETMHTWAHTGGTESVKRRGEQCRRGWSDYYSSLCVSSSPLPPGHSKQSVSIKN